MKKIKQVIMMAMLTVGLGLIVMPASVGAVNAIADTCKDPLNASTVICKSQGDSIKTTIGVVVNTLLFLVGIASVVVIIIGGITYTTSAGSSDAIKRAKDMITYAVIGLLIAISAYAIVNWILKLFT
jgi:hypothetical protein